MTSALFTHCIFTLQEASSTLSLQPLQPTGHSQHSCAQTINLRAVCRSWRAALRDLTVWCAHEEWYTCPFPVTLKGHPRVSNTGDLAVIAAAGHRVESLTVGAQAVRCSCASL